jgi:hypothetical protein
MPLEYFNSLGAIMQLITFVVVGVVHLCTFKQRPLPFITQRQCREVHKHTNASAIFTGLLGTISDTTITALCTRNDGWVRQ